MELKRINLYRIKEKIPDKEFFTSPRFKALLAGVVLLFVLIWMFLTWYGGGFLPSKEEMTREKIIAELYKDKNQNLNVLNSIDEGISSSMQEIYDVQELLQIQEILNIDYEIL